MMKPIHYLQIADERTLSNPLRKKCMQSVRNIVRPEVDTYEFVNIPSSDNVVQMVMRSDQIRFERAANDPNLCYVDTDCFLVRPFEPVKEGVPYFPIYEFAATPEPFPDPFLFYVNGDCKFFKDCLKKGLHNEQTYGFDLGLLKDMRGYETVPPDTFVHCYISLSAMIERQKAVAYVENLELEIAAYRTNIQQNALTMKLLDKLKGR